MRESPFKDIWIQPAAGDAGGALGAALSVWYEYKNNSRETNSTDTMKGSYLENSFSESEISNYLDDTNANYKKLSTDELRDTLVSILASENVVGWFQGKMEFGPRALGARSIHW